MTMQMKQIDNKNELLRDDLKTTIKKGSKVSIAAAYFSIYAFRELKKELGQIDELRFIFTSPPSFQMKKERKSPKRILYSQIEPRTKSIWNRI
ncbi:hypothetical protein [Allobaculum sp. Allo2]|uniref:hypothetical protein n=1 Tax=Allobaculum sp. Allo2 TaxID=2853432 RepID=UPI001F623FF2|nr:hypothetical protein [Allobaculum sp. Allo2]UNT93147.1 hypothetical protein KWG61_14205 [Allobaculum sp. Allo2]